MTSPDACAESHGYPPVHGPAQLALGVSGRAAHQVSHAKVFQNGRRLRQATVKCATDQVDGFGGLALLEFDHAGQIQTLGISGPPFEEFLEKPGAAREIAMRKTRSRLIQYFVAFSAHDFQMADKARLRILCARLHRRPVRDNSTAGSLLQQPAYFITNHRLFMNKTPACRGGIAHPPRRRVECRIPASQTGI